MLSRVSFSAHKALTMCDTTCIEYQQFWPRGVNNSLSKMISIQSVGPLKSLCTFALPGRPVRSDKNSASPDSMLLVRIAGYCCFNFSFTIYRIGG